MPASLIKQYNGVRPVSRSAAWYKTTWARPLAAIACTDHLAGKAPVFSTSKNPGAGQARPVAVAFPSH
jgi:hypothetical protein